MVVKMSNKFSKVILKSTHYCVFVYMTYTHINHLNEKIRPWNVNMF